MAETSRPMGRVRASLALLAGAVAFAAGIALQYFPAGLGGGAPRLEPAWIGVAIAAQLIPLVFAWIARPRRDTWVMIGLLPIAVVLALLMPVLGALEPAVRDLMVPAGVAAIGGATMIVAAIRYLEAREDLAMPASRVQAKKKVHIRREGQAKRVSVPVESLVAGDEVLLDPGEDVPADGVIESGSGFVDESELVGPSLPAPKKPGDALLAGSTATIPELVLRVAAPFSQSLLAQRDELARLVLEELVHARRADKLLAGATVAIAAASAGAILVSAKLGVLESWLPALTGLLLASVTAAGPLARAGARVATFLRVREAGLIISRAKDVDVLASVRRWQIDSALLAAPGEVEIAPLADVPANELLRAAEALLSGEPGPEYASVRAARVKRKLAPAAAAALRKNASIYHGTIDGARWLMGPERAIEEEDPRAIDPTMLGSIGFLRDRGLITWLIAKPGDGVVGAIGIGLTAEVDAKTAAVALKATVMPGPPDATRQALATAAGIKCDGPPLGKRDATLLDENSPPPSSGLRVRVMNIRAPVELASEVCPRLLRPSLAYFGELVGKMKSGGFARDLRALLAALLPSILALVAYWTGTLSPLSGTVIALVALRTAIVPFKKP